MMADVDTLAELCSLITQVDNSLDNIVAHTVAAQKAQAVRSSDVVSLLRRELKVARRKDQLDIVPDVEGLLRVWEELARIYQQEGDSGNFDLLVSLYEKSAVLLSALSAKRRALKSEGGFETV
jgi:hypothetical protein